MLTILGLILILTPFLLIFCFKNKILGFLYIITGASIFHLLLALISQYFHFFSYEVILSINLLLALIVVFFLIKNKTKYSFKIKINWLVILAFLVIIFELWSVHYFYTGEISTIYGPKQVSQVSYSYPFFSDDWTGVAFTTYSIDNKALPIINPLTNNVWDKDFRNIFIGFFSGLAEIFLLFNLSPLLGFPILAIVFGSMICFLVYLFLKSSSIADPFAIIGALCLPWIMCSVNLPGIWNLFPFIGATILFLVSITALNLNKFPLALTGGLVSLFLYPPFIVIIGPTLLIGYLLIYKISIKTVLSGILGTIVLVIFTAGLIFVFQKNNWATLTDLFVKSLVRINDQGCIPNRAIWQIIPVGLLPIALLGFWSMIRKNIFSLIIPLSIGLLYWTVYAFCPYFLIIDYARIAIITSYLIMITVGYGVMEIFYFFRNKYPILNKEYILFYFEIIVLIIFIALSFFYTSGTNWKNLTLKYDFPSGEFVLPIFSPVNNYLNQEDLKLFEGISQKNFLSLPWKSLVIGVATNNYPLCSKGAIITSQLMNYDFFMSLNCMNKYSEAKKFEMEYLYSTPVYCPNFIELSYSQEGLYLYKFQP